MTSGGEPRIIGRVPFTDGVTRDGFEDKNGRQWVVDDDGEPAFGLWLPPAEESVVVEVAPTPPVAPVPLAARRRLSPEPYTAVPSPAWPSVRASHHLVPTQNRWRPPRR
jgi:hypothetical protein